MNTPDAFTLREVAYDAKQRELKELANDNVNLKTLFEHMIEAAENGLNHIDSYSKLCSAEADYLTLVKNYKIDTSAKTFTRISW